MQTMTRPKGRRQHTPMAFEPGTWPDAAAHDVRIWLQAVLSVWLRG